MGIATEPADVLRFALDRMEAGIRVALVTLVAIEGSSSRALGNQMAVDEAGTSIGSFSGGCIDAAIIAEALDVIAKDRGCQLRFGAGSPFIDIRLPCGGGVDLLFTPAPEESVLRQALANLEDRELVCLGFSPSKVAIVRGEETAWRGECFHLTYHPRLQIVALGQGDDLMALAKLAHAFGGDVVAITPASSGQHQLKDQCVRVIEARTLTSPILFQGDRWTAFVSLFHDRDWELALLPHMLRQEGFFHGAIGSSRTQSARIAALGEHITRSQLDRLRGSVGLIPSTRDPATLALSILSEIVAEYRECACAPMVTVGKRLGANSLPQ